MSRDEKALENAVRHEMRPQAAAVAAVPERKRDERLERRSAPKNPCIVTLNDPESPAAEEYRKLKTTVLRLAPQNRKQHTFVVTSSISGEGKSLTAINVAVSMAQDIDQRVLLIDCDLRRPSLSEYLGITVHTGLAQCLREGAPVQSAILKTGVPGLELLPAGKAVRNPVEILSSPRMRSLVNEVKRLAPDRTVIIDTPPVLPFAETQVLSSLADGVLFIVKEGESTVQEVRDSLDLIAGANLLGIVFNGVTDVAMTNRYHHYYRYYAARRHQAS